MTKFSLQSSELMLREPAVPLYVMVGLALGRSMLTVLPAGGTADGDQFPAVDHWPLLLVAQLYVCPAARPVNTAAAYAATTDVDAIASAVG